MKKILILLSFVFLLSGCTASYEITINGNHIDEKLKIIETDKTIFDSDLGTGWTLRESLNAILEDDEFGTQDYKIKDLSNNNRLGVEYSSLSLESIINSSIINQCYKNPIVDISGDIVIINTGDDFECYDLYDNLDTIKVEFKTNHKVLSSNADEVKNGKYIWNMTRDDIKSIEISYDNSITKINFIPYVIITLVFICICFGLWLVFNKIKHKNSF